MKRGNTLFRLLVFLVVLTGVFYLWQKKDISNFVRKEKASSRINTDVSHDIITLQEAFVSVARELSPSVVNISSIQMVEYLDYEFYFGDPFEYFFGFEDFFDSRPKMQKKRQYKREGGGSGVIISEDGYILTNEHVIHDASQIKVRVNIDGIEKTYSGKVIGKDKRTDIAIVKINAKKLKYAILGDSDKIRIGEWVIAIGSPFGLEQTVTSGIISALRQSVNIEGKSYKNFIQTDAAINRGNSGGPLINIKGEVIGINTAIYAPTGVFSGIGFAIPVNSAKEIMNDLINRGKVIRGWLGIEVLPVDSAIIKQFNLKDKSGVLVNSVYKNTPAIKCGMKRGDVIVEFAGEKINNPEELQKIVSNIPPRKKIKVKIVRNGKILTFDLITEEMPADDEITDTEMTGEN